MDKEKLIGTNWECPRCHEQVEITVNGIIHGCKSFWIRYSLEDIVIGKEFEERSLMNFLYGQSTGNNHK
jgi:hypothetical protein